MCSRSKARSRSRSVSSEKDDRLVGGPGPSTSMEYPGIIVSSPKMTQNVRLLDFGTKNWTFWECKKLFFEVMADFFQDVRNCVRLSRKLLVLPQSEGFSYVRYRKDSEWKSACFLSTKHSRCSWICSRIILTIFLETAWNTQISLQLPHSNGCSSES